MDWFNSINLLLLFSLTTVSSQCSDCKEYEYCDKFEANCRSCVNLCGIEKSLFKECVDKCGDYLKLIIFGRHLSTFDSQSVRSTLFIVIAIVSATMLMVLALIIFKLIQTFKLFHGTGGADNGCTEFLDVSR